MSGCPRVRSLNRCMSFGMCQTSFPLFPSSLFFPIATTAARVGFFTLGLYHYTKSDEASPHRILSSVRIYRKRLPHSNSGLPPAFAVSAVDWQLQIHLTKELGLPVFRHNCQG